MKCLLKPRNECPTSELCEIMGCQDGADVSDPSINAFLKQTRQVLQENEKVSDIKTPPPPNILAPMPGGTPATPAIPDSLPKTPEVLVRMVIGGAVIIMPDQKMAVAPTPEKLAQYLGEWFVR